MKINAQALLRYISIVCVSIILSACWMPLGNLEGSPGYADFSTPNAFEANSELNLTLGPSVLSLIRAGMKDEPDAALLKDLRGLRLKIYEVKNSKEKILDHIQKNVVSLKKQEWQQAVSINGEDEQVSILIKMAGETLIEGVMMMVINQQEAVFVNVLGNISAENVSKLVDSLRDKRDAKAI